MTISRWGFCVTAFVYILLLLAEYLRPGFVSTAMNVHICLVMLFGWGILLKNVRSSPEENRHHWWSWCLLLIMSTMAMVIVWNIGEVFGDMRALFAGGVGVLAFILMK